MSDLAYTLFMMSIPIWPSLLLGLVMVLLLRKRVRGHQRTRIILALVFMLIGFVLSSVLAAGLLGIVMVGVADYYSSVNISEEYRDEVIQEFMRREIVPAAIRPTCMTTEAICELLDEVLYGKTSDGRTSHRAFPSLSMVIGLVAAMLNGALVWFNTRSKNVTEPLTPPAMAGGVSY